MTNPRFKPLLIGAITLLVVWAVAWTAFRLAADAKMTPEKMAIRLRNTDLSKLDANARAKELRELADKLNQLTGEDRRRARSDREWDRLWREMNEAEKADFIDRTMPSGVKQMLASFEQLPEEKRRYAITNAIGRMKQRRESGDVDYRGEREPLSEDPEAHDRNRIENLLRREFCSNKSRGRAVAGGDAAHDGERPDVSPMNARRLDTPSDVAEVFDLPYRRPVVLEITRSSSKSCDTADQRSALR